MRRLLLRLVAIAATIAVTAIGAAQPGPDGFASIERMASDVPLIVRGEITALEPPARDASAEESSWLFVTMRVDETLKGEPRREVRFAVSGATIPNDGVVARWAANRVSILAFLRDSRALVPNWRLAGPGYEFARFPLAPRRGGWRDSLLALDPKGREGIQTFTMDLRPLARSEAILARTRAAIRETPGDGPIPTYHVDVGALSLQNPRPSGSTIGDISVPCDARLERIAWGWVRASDPYLRVEGARALGRFRSKANEATLRGLLNDPATVIYGDAENGTPEIARLIVRDAARRVLEGWGVRGHPALRPDREMPRTELLVSRESALAAWRDATDTRDSLERMTGDAELVVRGEIVRIDRRIIANDPTDDYYRDAVWDFVTLRITETLKGPHHREVRFAVQSWQEYYGSPLDGWCSARTPLLVFLDSSRGRGNVSGRDQTVEARYEFRPRFGGSRRWIVPLVSGEAPMFTMTPARHDRPEDVLAATRAAAGAIDLTDGEGGVFTIELPLRWAERREPTVVPLRLSLPVGPSLERLARGWLASSDPRRRWWGIRALGIFRSESNAKLLRDHLAGIPEDATIPKNSTWNGAPYGGNPPARERAARMRAEIRHILRAWDLERAGL